MGGKKSIWILLATMILAFLSTAIIVFRIDPFKATVLEKSLFFVSAGIGTLGIIFLVGPTIFKNKR